MADDDTSSTDVTQPFQIATAADPAHVMPLGDNPAKTISDLTGKYHGPSQECVASVQELNNLGRTSTWTPLGPVGGDTQVGAPIATFNKDGKYTNTPGTSHAGTYLGVDANGNMVVGEQWDGKTWHTTTIPNTGKGGWRDAASYSVVGSNKPMQTNPDDEPPSVAIPKLASPQDEPPSVAIPKLAPPATTAAPAGQTAVPDDQPPSTAIPAIRGPGFVPTTTIPPANQPPPGSVAERALNAFHMGFIGDVMGPINDQMKKIPGVAWMDKQFPALGRLDENVRAPTDEEQAKYDKKYGDDVVSQVGQFAGQQVAISPLLLATEGLGGMLAAKIGLPAARTVLANPKLAEELANSDVGQVAYKLWQKAGSGHGLDRADWATAEEMFSKAAESKVIQDPVSALQKLSAGAVRMGSGAIQGATSSLASGGNALYGMVGGAALHGAGQAFDLLSKTDVVQKVLSSPPVVAALAAAASYKLGGSGLQTLTTAVEAATASALGKVYHGTEVVGHVVNGILKYAIAPALKYGAGPGAAAINPYSSDNKMGPPSVPSAPGLVPTP